MWRGPAHPIPVEGLPFYSFYRRSHPRACTCVDCIQKRLSRSQQERPALVACPSCLDESGTVIQIRTGERIRCPTCLGQGKVSAVLLENYQARRTAEAIRNAERKAQEEKDGPGAPTRSPSSPSPAETAERLLSERPPAPPRKPGVKQRVRKRKRAGRGWLALALLVSVLGSRRWCRLEHGDL